MGKSKFAAPVFLLFFRGCSRFLRQLAARVLGDYYFSFPPNFRLGGKKEKKNIGLKSGVMRFSPSRIFFWGEATGCVVVKLLLLLQSSFRKFIDKFGIPDSAFSFPPAIAFCIISKFRSRRRQTTEDFMEPSIKFLELKEVQAFF